MLVVLRYGTHWMKNALLQLSKPVQSSSCFNPKSFLCMQVLNNSIYLWQLSLLLLFGEPAKIVSDQMKVAAAGTSNQHHTTMVGLLGKLLAASSLTDLACVDDLQLARDTPCLPSSFISLESSKCEAILCTWRNWAILLFTYDWGDRFAWKRDSR